MIIIILCTGLWLFFFNVFIIDYHYSFMHLPMIIIIDISCVTTINSCIAWLSMVYGPFIGTFSFWLAPHLSHISFENRNHTKTNIKWKITVCIFHLKKSEWNYCEQLIIYLLFLIIDFVLFNRNVIFRSPLSSKRLQAHIQIYLFRIIKRWIEPSLCQTFFFFLIFSFT